MIPTCSYFFIKSHISNLLRPMEFSLKQVKSGYGPLYILRGQRLYFFKKNVYFFQCRTWWNVTSYGISSRSSLFVIWITCFVVSGEKKNMLNFTNIFSWFAWYARYVFVNSWCWCSAYVARQLKVAPHPLMGSRTYLVHQNFKRPI